MAEPDNVGASDRLPLIETCKMNSVDPHAWLANTLISNVNGHKQSRIDDLIPWNYAIKV